MHARLALLAALCVSALAAPAQAQSWPSKPVRIVVPVAAGGGIDSVARAFGQKFSESWKQPVVVENRPGAGSTIGADLVAKSPPDGYTFLVNSSSQAVTANLYPKLPFDSVKDFAPVTQLISTYLILVVNPKVPAQSVKELIALAKAQPGRLNFGSTGMGGSPHLIAELFAIEAGIQAVHIPYKGDAPLQPAMLAGEIHYAFLTPSAVMQHLKTGRMRALAVTGNKRAAIAPDLPTMSEAGLPDFEYVGWIGIFAPAATPRDILGRVSDEAIRALKMPDILQRVPGWGGEPAGTTPEEFSARYRSDVEKIGRIVREAHVPMVN